jgi:hypothetical protein
MDKKTSKVETLIFAQALRPIFIGKIINVKKEVVTPLK